MAAKRKRSVRKSDPTMVYQLKITLLETNPPIWRRLQVPADVTLGDLNYIIQAAMGWTNSHLHQFTISETRYSDPRFELDEYDAEVAKKCVMRCRFAADVRHHSCDHEILHGVCA